MQYRSSRSRQPKEKKRLIIEKKTETSEWKNKRRNEEDGMYPHGKQLKNQKKKEIQQAN